ncbi:MAG: MFS transporter [Bacteroidia bacterium]|nr:MFS transporter [Bacteroidia bacterium]
MRILILVIFFVISFLTNIIGPLIPEITQDFHLSLTMAGLLPSSFFLAYGLMSIPAGLLLERFGARVVMGLSFGVALGGALAFTCWPRYEIAIGSLFAIGSGMAMLQVMLYPLLRTVGGESKFAYNAVLAQLMFGLASFFSPMVYSRLVAWLAMPAHRTGLWAWVPEDLTWISMYGIFSVVTLVMLGVTAVVPLPVLHLQASERSGTAGTYLHLLRQPLVWMYVGGIFCYVGLEQGINNWTSSFLQQYHQADPATTGAQAVAWFWGLMTAGTLLGLGAVRLLDSRRVLTLSVLGAALSLTAGLYGPAPVALWGFPVTGFFASVMFSIVIDLALNSLPDHHGAFSGLLMTGIVGGSVFPLIMGAIGDQTGLRVSMAILYGVLGYLLWVSLVARPLTHNQTVPFRDLFKR